jgi:hypothetical protein
MKMSVGWIAVALYLGLFVLALRSPYFAAFRGATVVVMILVVLRDWREKGRGWLPTLSWVVPFGIVWFAGEVLIERPEILAMAVWAVGFGIVVLMLSDRPANWWYRAVSGLLK